MLLGPMKSLPTHRTLRFWHRAGESGPGSPPTAQWPPTQGTRPAQSSHAGVYSWQESRGVQTSWVDKWASEFGKDSGWAWAPGFRTRTGIHSESPSDPAFLDLWHRAQVPS